MANSIIYTADRIFTGQQWLNNHAIIVEEGIIKNVIPSSPLPPNIAQRKFDKCFIAPAFIDLQIYGAYGKLLAAYPEADSLFKLNEYCRRGGAALCLPTVATNPIEVFHSSIDAVRQYWQQGGKGILGLHLEGPWMNAVKRGAHTESLIHSPSLKEVEELLDYGKGVIKMITLAPEVCSKEVIDLIGSHDIIISAGHSNATYNEAINSFGIGITTVTHLYNAMSPLQHRAPGLVGATLDHSSITASIIPDGHHVDYAAIRVAKQVMKDRLFVITDAVTETDKGDYRHKKAGDKYESGGILSGSALTMSKALQNLVNHCGIELAEALRMCSLYPARVAKLHDSIGIIKEGYKACFVVLDNNLNTITILLE